MLTNEQIKQLLTENEALQAQLQESTEILAIKEEELALLKQNAADFAELQSKYNSQLNDLGSMQNHIGKKQQHLEGAANREKELYAELDEAYEIKEQYDTLLQEYAAARSELSDTQQRLSEMTDRNITLEQTARNAAALQSELDIAIIEKETLQLKIDQLEAAAIKDNL
jgi:chromosome segregation ATPase